MTELKASGKPTLTNQEIVQQVQALLDNQSEDLQKTLLKEMLLSVLKLKESKLDTLDIKILNRALKELR